MARVLEHRQLYSKQEIDNQTKYANDFVDEYFRQFDKFFE